MRFQGPNLHKFGWELRCVALLRAAMGESGVKSRVAFILVDGLGDVAIPSLGFKSPVEAAKTPNLDALASGGVSGLMDPVEPGLGCGSDTAHLSLLGYNPRVYYRGRGAFESLGAGLAMVPGDIAFKVRHPILCSVVLRS